MAIVVNVHGLGQVWVEELLGAVVMSCVGGVEEDRLVDHVN